MRVLLINPPSENEIIGNNPSIIEEERGYNPPLGLLYLASYLQDNTDYKVKIIDAQVEELTYPSLRQAIKRFHPDVVGITALTLALIDVVKTIDLVKSVDKNTKVVLGGPHVHIFPEETINLPGVDYLVLGEGEKPFCELLHAIEKGSGFGKIQGIVFRQRKRVVNTGIRDFVMNLDEFPFPARELTPYKKYSSLMAKRQPVTTMFTSRGCPFRCRFCDRPNLGKMFRARSAKNVVDEMEKCTKMGIYEFLVYDDTFTVDKQRVMDVCDEIIKRNLKIGWDIRSRVNTVDKEMLKKLKEANCERIHYGIESGSPKVLKALNKGITISQVKKAFALTKEVGIDTLAYFMMGNPLEGKKEIRQSIDLMKSVDPNYVHITVLTPFPATAIYFEALEKGYIKNDVWREFAKAPTADFVPPIWGEKYSRDELSDIVAGAYKEFYGRPKYIVRELSKVRSASEAKRKIKAGIKVIKMRAKN